MRLAHHEPNRLPPRTRGALRRSLAQFDNLLIQMLPGAAVITAAIGHATADRAAQREPPAGTCARNARARLNYLRRRDGDADEGEMTVRVVTTARHLFDVGGGGNALHCGFSLEDREALPQAGRNAFWARA